MPLHPKLLLRRDIVCPIHTFFTAGLVSSPSPSSALLFFLGAAFFTSFAGSAFGCEEILVDRLVGSVGSAGFARGAISVRRKRCEEEKKSPVERNGSRRVITPGGRAGLGIVSGSAQASCSWGDRSMRTTPEEALRACAIRDRQLVIQPETGLCSARIDDFECQDVSPLCAAMECFSCTVLTSIVDCMMHVVRGDTMLVKAYTLWSVYDLYG